MGTDNILNWIHAETVAWSFFWAMFQVFLTILVIAAFVRFLMND